jgi:hypothetical protein
MRFVRGGRRPRRLGGGFPGARNVGRPRLGGGVRVRRRYRKGAARGFVRKLHLIQGDWMSQTAIASARNDLVAELAASPSLRRRHIRCGRTGRLGSVSWSGWGVSRRGSWHRRAADRCAAGVAEAVARLDHHATVGASGHRDTEHISYDVGRGAASLSALFVHPDGRARHPSVRADAKSNSRCGAVSAAPRRLIPLQAPGREHRIDHCGRIPL